MARRWARMRLVALIARLEPRVREMASRWFDSLPAEARAELLAIANDLLAPLLDEPPRRRRRRPSRR